MSSQINLDTNGIIFNKPTGKDSSYKCESVTFQRHAPGDEDIAFDLKYCGICHSDVHATEGPEDKFKPVVPGHELAGIVTYVGSKVKNFKVGDKIGVGCMVDSCHNCEFCEIGDEQFCEKGCTMTYGGEPKHGRAGTEITRGGYSDKHVVHEKFAIKIPETMDLKYAGPIMCAGITVYEPLKHYNAGSEHVKRIGIVGGGGLGHMGIKIAKSMGCEVTAITTSPSKVDHLKKLGATTVIVSTDEEAMKKGAKSLDLILNTISADHDVMHYQPLLRPNATLVCLGLVQQPHPVPQVPLIMNRNAIAGSLIGGVRRTQEIVDLCEEKQIYPDVVVVDCNKADDIFAELQGKSTTVQRYVFDIANTMQDFMTAHAKEPKD